MVKVIDCSIKINACRITLRTNQGTPQNGLLNFLLTVWEILLERLTIVHAFQAIFFTRGLVSLKVYFLYVVVSKKMYFV